MKKHQKVRGSLFEQLFCRYGAGSHIFKPLTNWRLWNRIAWTLVVLGILGWGVGLWLIKIHTE